jgi:hypothetical protein
MNIDPKSLVGVDYSPLGNPITGPDLALTGAFGPLIQRIAQRAAEYGRNAGLEAAIQACKPLKHYGEVSGILCVKAIEALKEQP